MLEIDVLPVGDWQANCYLLTAGTGQRWLIDPGANAPLLRQWIGDRHPEAIVLTHADHDHVGALDVLAEAYGAPVWAHPAAQARLERVLDQVLGHGERVALGGVEFEVRHVPGHSPDGLALIGGGHCISGDSLFPGGPGRTRSPQDFMTLLAAIERELLTLDPAICFHPGHGTGATIGEAREAVAAFRQWWRGEPLSGDVTWVPT